MARIFPDWDAINSMNNPLTKGEKALAKFLYENLSDNWEIYVQPFLNGDRPDIVILNPHVGVMIYEVKDLNLDLYYWESNRLFVKTINGSYPTDNPIEQVRHYKNSILNLYIPSLREKIDQNPKALSLIRTGVYFHEASTQEVSNFLQNSKYTSSVNEPIIGFDSLHKNNLKTVVPDCNWTQSKWINSKDSHIFETLRNWLSPPFHSKQQGTKIKLDDSQKRHAEPKPGHHRIKAVAGSGKTLILAYRAAKLASEGKRVLVITFNITLWHYIRDQIARTPFDFDWKNIVFKHFHGFCSDECKRLGIEWPNSKENDQLFKTIIPNRLIEVITGKIPHKASKDQLNFDAILIDEGQDYYWEWYNLICHYLNERNELLLVCDTRQNIYQRDIDSGQTHLNSVIHAQQGF